VSNVDTAPGALDSDSVPGGEATGGPRRPRRASANRQSLLVETPAALGAAWAHGLCAGMQREGRSIEGGWPGTVVEARARVLGHLVRELARRGMAPPSTAELTSATEITYDRARRHWLEVARRGRGEAGRGEAGG
jgi:hypothetical protein